MPEPAARRPRQPPRRRRQPHWSPGWNDGEAGYRGDRPGPIAVAGDVRRPAGFPGLAAQIFDDLAKAGIVVDMIVQSIGRENRANISFTVPQKDLEKTLKVAGELAKRWLPAPRHCPEWRSSPCLAWACGATRAWPPMFQSLAPEGDQRRSDQHQRSPRQRRGRPRQGGKARARSEGIRRCDGVSESRIKDDRINGSEFGPSSFIPSASSPSTSLSTSSFT